MNPDRSSYELWLSEWLDGKLTGHQAEQFSIFLDENPDLKEEADFLSHIHLIPSGESYPGKSLLKKSAEELPSSQVEYLSVAYLENDLTPGQYLDLRQKIDKDNASRVLFDSVQQIKLTPQPVSYMHKNKLKKSVPGTRIIRLSLIGLSAAATVALVILSSILAPRIQQGKKDAIVVNSASSGEPFVAYSQVSESLSEDFQDTEILTTHSVGFVPDDALPLTGDLPIMETSADSPSILRAVSEFRIDTFPHFNISLISEPFEYSLVASTLEIKQVLYEDERNKLSKLIARTFRDKILKDETGSDAPVKPYEIAAASLNGLNRLFGWDMSLIATNNEEGDLQSIYFSSRLLKFNAPVRKTDDGE